jgi:carboxypeptidase family protein
MPRLSWLLSVWGFVCVMAWAQAPTGVISGTVIDQSGAVIANATVTITEKAAGTVRSLITNNEGLYGAPALLAGEYEVRCEAPGFRTLVRRAVVTAGNPVTVDMQMALGQANDIVTWRARRRRSITKPTRSRAPLRTTRFRNCPSMAAAVSISRLCSPV